MSKLDGETLREEVRKVYSNRLSDVLAALADQADSKDIQAAFMDVTVEKAKERRDGSKHIGA